jgi:hypothetical protein
MPTYVENPVEKQTGIQVYLLILIISLLLEEYR